MAECPIPEKADEKIWLACCETCQAAGRPYEIHPDAMTWRHADVVASAHRTMHRGHDAFAGRGRTGA